MGNCLARCFGTLDRRKIYLQSRYSVERDQSIEAASEFENLMDDDNPQAEMSRLITDKERQLLRSRQFDAIVHEQTKIDKEIDEKLAQQEKELKQEEESYFEAKREASRIAKLQKAKEKAAKKNATINGSRTWLGDEEEWEVAGGEDDFEIFLANVKARSLQARAQLYSGQGDGQSSSSSTVHTKERSITEGSSLDLEWDHEAGVEPNLRARSHTEENLAELTSLRNIAAACSSIHSSDLEWDDSFVSADELERKQLLGISHFDNSVR